jgi:RNA polymerase sigma-70 factor (ECF subfamily)
MEEALLRALRQGSPEAFAALVAREGPAVYRYLRRMTGNHEDAADLTQEVFVRAYRGLARFEGRSGLRTWLLRIATNAYLDQRARLNRQALPLDAVASWADSPDHGPESVAERREWVARVEEAIRALPPRQRAALVLRLYGGHTYAEVADILGCAEGTVKASVFAALARLRARLGPLREGSR